MSLQCKCTRAGATALSLTFMLCHALLFTAVTVSAAVPAERKATIPQATDEPSLDVVRERVAGMGLPWVPNRGQWERGVAFRAQSFAGSVWLTEDGTLIHQFAGRLRPRDGDTVANPASPPAEPRARDREPDWVLTERFVSPLKIDHIEGEQPLGTKASFFLGADAAKYQSGIGSFGAVNLGEVYPGVNVRLKATGKNVEKLFTVEPLRDPSVIRVRIDGAVALQIAADGALEAQTDYGPIRYSKPVAFQTIEGQRREVPVQYALNAATSSYGFVLGEYDRDQAVTIDPIVQATFIGGGAWDEVFTMHRTLIQEILVAGYSQSNNLPCITFIAPPSQCRPPAQTYAGGNGDAFIARLNMNLTELMQVTYLGGTTGFEQINAINFINEGGVTTVVVAGHTSSTDFPCTTMGGLCASGAQGLYGGGARDGFVARLGIGLTTLLQSTYLGGLGDDAINGLDINLSSREIIVAGTTTSTNFPCVVAGPGCAATTTTAAQSINGGGVSDGFITRLNFDLTTNLQSTYLGGSGIDHIAAMKIFSNDIVVGGHTSSSNFPCTTLFKLCRNGGQSAKAAGFDGVVARLDPSLTILRQATYLGGNGDDFVTSVWPSATLGDIVVAGFTHSTDFSFATAGEFGILAARSTHGGGATDGFVTLLNGLLTNVLQSTYLGGSGADYINAITTDWRSGDVLVAGRTASSDFPCTTAGGGCAQGAQWVFGGGTDDGFIARFSPNLQTLQQATYLGGLLGDTVRTMMWHDSGDILVAGWTQSSDFPCTSVAKGCADGGQPLYAGGNDAFVARVTADLRAFNYIAYLLSFAPTAGVPVASLQTSLPVLVNGIDGPVPIKVSGEPAAKYCISSQNDCKCDLTQGNFVSTPGIIDNMQYVCAQQVASEFQNGVTFATVMVGATAGQFYVGTGTVLNACSLDVDGDGKANALTDGLLLVRAMLGMTGTAVTNGALGADAKRNDWGKLVAYLNGNCGAAFAP
ncbi:MAG: SBBP repeat-containing protein [Casimicrobiaceae bacterium]